MRLEEKEFDEQKCSVDDGLIEICLPSGLKLPCVKELIRKSSKIFDRMLDPIYTDSSKSSVAISDVNEDVFVAMVHFMHDCEIHINYFTTECVNCKYEHYEVPPQGERTQWRFIMDLLIIAERFCVHDLSKLCENFLSGTLSDENAGEVFMLSCWYNCEKLINDSLRYVLTNTRCPKYRTKYFAEILLSHEKDTFLKKIEDYLSGMLLTRK